METNLNTSRFSVGFAGLDRNSPSFPFIFSSSSSCNWLKTVETPWGYEWSGNYSCCLSHQGSVGSLLHSCLTWLLRDMAALHTVPRDVAFFTLLRLHFHVGPILRGEALTSVLDARSKASTSRLDRKCSLWAHGQFKRKKTKKIHWGTSQWKLLPEQPISSVLDFHS